MFFFVLCSRFFDVAFMSGSPFCDLGKKRSETKSQRWGLEAERLGCGAGALTRLSLICYPLIGMDLGAST
jgi:hypothetical protein